MTFLDPYFGMTFLNRDLYKLDLGKKVSVAFRVWCISRGTKILVIYKHALSSHQEILSSSILPLALWHFHKVWVIHIPLLLFFIQLKWFKTCS